MNLYLKLNLTPFASIFSYIYTFGAGSVFGIRIRIQELLNTDPIPTDPDSQHRMFEHKNSYVGLAWNSDPLLRSRNYFVELELAYSAPLSFTSGSLLSVRSCTKPRQICLPREKP